MTTSAPTLERASCDADVRDASSGVGVGRATVHAARARTTGHADAEPVAVDVWRFAAADERVAARLLQLGIDGVGGFSRGGVDEGGVWLVRRCAVRRAEDLARDERLPWREALILVRAVAAALAACERAGLFPGPLTPAGVVLAPEPAWILADALVGAIVGDAQGGTTSRSTPASPKWTPPDQLDGAAWDAAANRYVLGLVAYRTIGGVHPFRGVGLRHAIEQQAAGNAPPFAEAVARELRPGVQSFVLAMIDPDPAARPGRASEIITRATELLGDAPARSHESARPHPHASAREGGSDRAGEGRRGPSRAREPASPARARAVPELLPASAGPRPPWVTYAPIAVGLVIAAAAVALAGEHTAPVSDARPHVTPLEPVASAASSSADCVPCHAREVAEWQRSVMAHAGKSPLYGALESLVEEEVGRDARCPNGAGVLRKAGVDACRDDRTGIAVTGSGGEHWCVSCHAMGENISARMPAWSAFGAPASRAPMRDLLPTSSMEGVSCAGCHQTIGPVAIHSARASAVQRRLGGVNPDGTSGAYEGNATWTSTITGTTFLSRPEDREGRAGIANSGYSIDPAAFLLRRPTEPGLAHQRASRETTRYLESSEFCGACHDVRLFGSDAIGARDRGEHFKRLRNAYSEWRTWADGEGRAGRAAATCQGCHMSLFPGTCEAGAARGSGASGSLLAESCPSGSHFVPKAAGEAASAPVSPSSEPRRVASHWFTSVDIPLTESYPDAFADDRALDAFGSPIGLRARRDMILRKAFTFSLGEVRRTGARLEIPVHVENTGAGHRVPAGFSQEREIWVELVVRDARGAPVYEVGKLTTDDADLRDKVFVRVSTSDASVDARGRPLGVFGADVVDGPDVPRWSPNPRDGGTTFRGRGLVNFQNGFLRCVRCIGFVDASGACQAGPGQGRTRADRFDDGDYDADTGECRSNLSGGNELFETYFPVGALDADRGIAKAPDAIIDTRSAPPNVPITYTYDLDTGAHPPPFTVDARLRFRSFPPFLVKAFADYEARRDAERQRPSGAQVTRAMLRRLEIVDLAEAHARAAE